MGRVECSGRVVLVDRGGMERPAPMGARRRRTVPTSGIRIVVPNGAIDRVRANPALRRPTAHAHVVGAGRAVR